MSWTHVHIGAGKFGLGMVMDICSQAGFISAVLNRANNQDHHPALRQAGCYQISYHGGTVPTRTVRVDIHYYEDRKDSRAIELLAAPSVILLTTSVTPDGIEHVAPLIARALEERSTVADAKTLCVMACENLQLGSETLARQIATSLKSEVAKEFLRNKVVFCNTVVDRVCNEVTWNLKGVEVKAESFHEWVVEQPPAGVDAIRMLTKFVTLARNRAELKAYEMRKYWCLNGLHLAAAAYAYQYKKGNVYPHFEFLANALDIPEIRHKVEALQQELGFAFRCYAERSGVAEIFSEDDVEAYNDIVLRRFISNKKERVGRLLKHEDDVELAISAFVRSVWTAIQKEGLDSAIRKNVLEVVRVFDLHQFLARVSERVVGPQEQILSFYRHSGKLAPRLVLDDALQTITLATDRYAKKTYERALASVRRPHT